MRLSWLTILGLTGLLLHGCYPEQPLPNGVEDDDELLRRTLLPPSSFRIDAADSTFVHVRWKDESIQEDGFHLEMSVDDGPFSAVADIPPAVDSVTYYHPFIAGSRYAFRIRSFRDDAESDPSGTATLRHEEALFFLRYEEISIDIVYDAVFRVSNGRVERILRSGGPNYHQYNDIAFYGDSLILVGVFSYVENTPALRAAIWSASRWQSFGDGILDLFPRKLVRSSTGLYVGSSLSLFSQSYLYRWSGAAFVSLSAIPINVGGYVLDGTEYDGTTYFVLDGARASDGTDRPIAVVGFRGQTLVSTPQPDAPFLPDCRQTGIAASGGYVYISLTRTRNSSGHTIDTSLIQFNGSVWTVADTSSSRTTLHSLAAWRNELFGIRSTHDSIGREIRSEILRWTGNSWVSFREDGTSMTGLWSTPDALIASSMEESSGNAFLHKWNGGSWSILAQFSDGISPRAVAARPSWIWDNG